MSFAQNLTTLSVATGTDTGGAWKQAGNGLTAVMASLGGSATAATVLIEGSIDLVGSVLLATITLSGTTTSDGVSFPDSVNFPYIRAHVTSFTGTGSVTTSAVIEGGV